jgi:hypothetical protein
MLWFTSYSLLNMDNFCKTLILNYFWTVLAGANLQHASWCWWCLLAFCRLFSCSQASLSALSLNTLFCALARTCHSAKFSYFPVFSYWYKHTKMHFCYKEDVSTAKFDAYTFYTSYALCLLQHKLQCIVMRKHDCIAASPEAQTYQPNSLLTLAAKAASYTLLR